MLRALVSTGAKKKTARPSAGRCRATNLCATLLEAGREKRSASSTRSWRSSACGEQRTAPISAASAAPANSWPADAADAGGCQLSVESAPPPMIRVIAASLLDQCDLAGKFWKAWVTPACADQWSQSTRETGSKAAQAVLTSHRWPLPGSAPSRIATWHRLAALRL